MAICNLDQNKELKKTLATYLNFRIKDNLKTDKPFKFLDLMNDVYKIAYDKDQDVNKALGIAGAMPGLFEQILKKRPEYIFSLASKGFKLDPIISFKKEIQTSTTPLQTVGKYIRGLSTPSVSQAIKTGTDFSEGSGLTLQKEAQTTPVYSDVKMLKHTFFATTIRTNIRKEDGTYEIDQKDPDKISTQNTVGNLLAKQGSDLNFENVSYQGQDGFRLRGVVESALPNPEKNAFIQNSSAIVLAVTNKEGEYIYFDKEGNITTAENGRIAYQYLQSIDPSRVEQIKNGLLKQVMPDLVEQAAGDEVLLEKLTKEKKRIIDKIIDDEVRQIQDIKADVNTNKKVLLNITGGETGFIDDRNTKVTLSYMIDKGGLNNEEIASIGAVFAKGPNGFDNPTVKFRNFPQRITLKGLKIGEANPELLDKLVNLFVDDLIDINDTPVSPQDKINLAKQFLEIITEEKNRKANKLFLAPAANNKLTIFIGNNPLSLEDKEAAKQQLKDFLNKNAYHTFIKKPGDSYTNFNIDGNVLKQNIQSGYKRYIAQYLVPRIMVDQNTGTAMVNNGYFTFSPVNLAETIEQETKKVVEEAKKIIEKPENKPLPEQDDPLPDLFERSKLIKSRANKAQKEAATKWLSETGLLKMKINGKPVITEEQLLDVVNSDAFASFANSTMTLYKGGDSTHMYHEAWHAFSQVFLTKAQRDELYKNASKLDATFTYIKKVPGPGGNTNKTVTVNLNTLNSNNKADRRILEEFIAEEFRIYAMNNGKFKVKDTKASFFEKIFKQIWEFLKALFKGTIPVNVYSNPGSNVFAKMFNSLYTAKTDKDLSMYTPSIKNGEQFGTLNKGIIDELSDLDLELLSKSIDGIISEAVTKYISQGNLSASMVIFNPKNLDSVYNVIVKKRLSNRLEQLTDEHKANQGKLTQAENDHAVNNIRILTKALDNFGDINTILKSKNPENSVVAHHLKNSAFSGRIKEASLDPTDKDNTWRDLLSGNDKSPNDFASEDLATANAKYVIESLVQQEYNANKTAVVNKVNELGFPQTIEFKPFWNFLMTKVGGQQDEMDLYNELVKLKEKKINPLVAQLLDKLGNPSEVMSKNKIATDLWLGVVRSMNPYRIDFHNNVFDIQVIEPEEEGEESKEVLTATSGKVSADYFTIRNTVWKNKFNLDVGPYVKLNPVTQQNELNLKAIVDEFLNDPTNPKQRVLSDKDKLVLKYTLKPGDKNKAGADPIAFLNAIGLYMSNDDQIRNRLDLAGVESIANAIGYAYYNNKSISDPQGFLSKSQILNVRKLQGEEIIEIKGQRIQSNASNVNNLATLEASYSTDYSSQMKKLPSGDLKSINSFNSTVTRTLNAINKVKNIDELGNIDNKYGIVPQLIYNKNPKVKGSVYVKSLFSDGVKQEGREMEIRELVGAQVRLFDGSVEGISQGEMSGNEKFVSDLLSMLQTGFIEAVRNGEKSTYTGMRPNKIETDPSYDKKSNHLFFDTEDYVIDVNGLSVTGINVNSILNRVMHEKLEGELRVIQKLKQGITKEQAEELGIDPKDAKDFYKNHVKNFSNGFKFDWFDDILESVVDKGGIKKELIDTYADKMTADSNTSLVDLLLSTPEGKELKKKIDAQIKIYFQNLANRFKSIYTKIYGNTIPDFLKNLVTGKLTDLQKRDVTDEGAINALMMSFAVNTSLHTDEILTMVFGDGFQFNHNKDEGLKRVPTYHSPGIVFSTGNNSIAGINTFYAREYERKLIADGVITDRTAPRAFSKIGQKAIIKDPEVATLQYESYEKLFFNILSKRNYSEAEVENLMYGDGDRTNPGKGSIMHTWKNITMADGQGYVGFDYYRQLKGNENSWTNAQEIVYQKEIRGEYISAEEIFDAFPVYKLQYAGALALPGDMYPIQSIDKFSLLPLIPSLIKNTPLETIHREMIQQGVDYILFDSAAKRSYIKSGESNGDEIFEGNDTSKLKPGFKFTKNPFFVDFLKNQTEVNKSAKNKATLSTQFRKIFDTGLYENGLPVDYKGTKETWNKLTTAEKESQSKVYKNSEKVLHELSRLTKYMRRQLLKEMGWKEVNGELQTLKGKQDLTKMLTYIKGKLKEQGYSQNDIDNIETNDGKIDLSTSPIAPRLERFLNSIINNKLVKLKILGEPLVQVSSAFFGFTNATEEQLAQYKDDDFGLSGYVVDPEGKIDPKTGERVYENTKGVKVKVALTKNYENLYQTFYFAKDKDGNYKNTGETIAVYNDDMSINHEASFKRLNEMLKVNEWLADDNNRAKIQLTGVRIPVQGPNSTEFAEIFEFLPPSAGTIIIIPREIVAKSGGDFDVDKLTMYIKKITKQGSILFDTVNAPEDLDARIKELEKKLGINGKKLNINNYLADFKAEINDVKEHIEFSQEQIDAFTSEDDKALLETLSNKQNQKYLAEVAPEAYAIYEKNIKSFDIKEYDKVQQAIIDLRNKNTELAKDYNELSDLKEHKRNFAAAIQNSMLDSLIKVLEMPEMAFSLLLPNGTYLAKPQADALQKIISKVDNEVDYTKSINTGEKIAGRDKGVSPSSLRDYSYNLKKQQDFAAGKRILGPIVLEIPINSQLNKAGALLNPSVDETIFVKRPGSKEKEKVKVTTPITLELKHNFVDAGTAAKEIRRISMSNILDADKKNQIADVLSQLTNGAVDVGKDAWIAYLQGNLEAIPKLLFLLETGVPATHAFYFMNNPLIREYVATKQRAGSRLAKLFYGSNHNKKAMIDDFVEAKLKNIKGVNQTAYDYLNTFWGKYNLMKSFIDSTNVKAFDLDALKNIAEAKGTEDQVMAGFLQYLYLERLTTQHDDLKKALDVDNNTTGNNAEIQAKIEQVEEVEELPIYDEQTTDYLINKSVISSFFIQEFASKLFGERLFEFRANKSINKFVRDAYKDFNMRSKIKALGLNQETFDAKFKNALTLHIFTQAVTKLDLKEVLKKGYNGYSVAELLEGSKVGSIEQAIQDFEMANYSPSNKSSQGYVKRGLYPVSGSYFAGYTKNDFIKFTLEREYLRKVIMPLTPLLKESKEYQSLMKRFDKQVEQDLQVNGWANLSTEDKDTIVYEYMLLHQALLNTYNNREMFQSGENTVAKKLMDIIRDYPELGLKYSNLINRFSLDAIPSPDGVSNPRRNFKLKANSDISDAEIADYVKSWKELADPSKHKLDSSEPKDVAANKYISDFFAKLPLFSFLQSGLDPTQFSMNSVMPQTMFKPIMEAGMQDFKKNVLSGKEQDINNVLNRFFNLFLDKNSKTEQAFRGRGINYKKELYEKVEELPEAQPEPEKEPIINYEQREAFKAAVEKNQGTLPKEYFTTPDSRWLLNPNNLYDLVDKTTGQIYLRDINLETGFQQIPGKPIEIEETKVNIAKVDKPKILKNENGLIIAENVIPKAETIKIVEQAKDFIEQTSFKQTGGAASWGYGMQWMRINAMSPKQREGLVIGKQLNGLQITQAMKDNFIKTGESKGFPLYGYTTIDKNGNKLPAIPQNIINYLSSIGIDISQYDASYNSVYDKADNGSLIIHQDNSETNTSPIITISLGRPMKFVTYELNNPNDFNVADSNNTAFRIAVNAVKGEALKLNLIPATAKDNKGNIKYGHLTPDTLLKYAEQIDAIQGSQLKQLVIDKLKEQFKNAEKTEYNLNNGAVLVFSGNNRNVLHEIVFDSETNRKPMESGFPTLSINKAFKGLGQEDRMVDTNDYRVVLTLRKVEGATATNVVDEQKLTGSITQAPAKLQVVADIPQNKVSGIESFGSLVTANNAAIKALGPNPHSIDMIEAGYRTRTTRSATEMLKYGINVGDIIKHFGKSADGSTKTIYARVTAIHPKGSPGWESTWTKEGWRESDAVVLDRFAAGAAAIEFELVQPVAQDIKELLKMPYKGYENVLWYWFVEKAKLNDPSKVEAIKNAKDYHSAYLIGNKIKNTEESDRLFNAIVQEAQQQVSTSAPVVESKRPTPVFNTLPGKSDTPTMTYAGIGSRETPQEVLDVMTKAATYLESLGYTLRSGGAEGADTAFEKGVKSKKQIFGGMDKTGDREKAIAHEIHPNLRGAMEGSKRRAIEKGKNGDRSAWAVENLMARNTNQVFGNNLDTPVDFVLAYDKSGWTGEGPRPTKGGTLQAIDMAYRKGIPVINMANDNWREQLKEALKKKPVAPTTETSVSTIKGIEISSKVTGLGNDLTNVHYATNGKSKYDIVPTDKSLKLTAEAKNTWGESVEAWYKSNNAKSKGIPEGVEGDAYDMKLMVGLITDKLNQYPDLVSQITEKGGLAFLDKSTHSMGTGRWSSNNPKNMFINALKQAYQNVTQSQAPVTETVPQKVAKGVSPYRAIFRQGSSFSLTGTTDYLESDVTLKQAINKAINESKNSEHISILKSYLKFLDNSILDRNIFLSRDRYTDSATGNLGVSLATEFMALRRTDQEGVLTDRQIQTIVHEVTHMLTLQPFIKEADKVELTAKEKEFLKEIRDLYAYIKTLPESKDKDFDNAIKDEYEFIADAIADEKFRKYLNSINYTKGKSILTKIIEAIKKLLGVTSGTALETVIDQVYSLREDSNFKHYDTLHHLIDELRIKEDTKFLKKNLTKEAPATEPTSEGLPNDKYQYYGAPYEIVRDADGVGIDVVGYKGKASAKAKLLEAYNNNPNIDPQNGKPFREEKGPEEEIKAFDQPVKEEKVLPVFSYQGKTINTDFQLTDQQDNALKQLIDFVENGTEKVITLSGYAGTGKTSMIKYLEKFLPKSNYKFIYSAPTHAATVYLALSTGVFPFTVPQLIRGKYNPNTGLTEYAPSKKFEESLSIHKDNILVIDEASMIGNKEITQLLAGIPDGVKVIFMGDEAQIPEVGAKGQTKKNISKVFTDFRNLQLTDVKRTNDNGILKVLTEIRNKPDGVLPIVPDTETLKYYDNAVNFKKAAFNAIKENPEGAVYISYVNNDVKDFNRQVREGLGYEGDLKEGEVITGYPGYNSKTVLDKNLGNSIKYTVDKVTVNPKGREGEVAIEFSSKLLEKIPHLVDKKATKGTTRYLQLSLNDGLTFEGITEEDMLNNNRKIAEILEEVYDAKVEAFRRPSAWRRFSDIVYTAGKKLASMDLGNQYIYNPSTRLMELYVGSPAQQKIVGPNNEFKELIIDRGIDYGYAITIHKSQGATFENVFYNASSVNNQTPLLKNGVQVGTEGNSLNYVGMSRASKTLSVLKGQYTKDLSKPASQQQVTRQPAAPTPTRTPVNPPVVNVTPKPGAAPAESKIEKRKKIILRSWKDTMINAVLAEKGYDINDFIAKLGAAQTDAEINEIINKLNRLLC